MATSGIGRRLLYALATSDRFESAVRRVPILERAGYELSKRYVAGLTFDDARATVGRLAHAGFAANIDFFGEQVTDAEEAARVADEYLLIAQRLNDLTAETSRALDLSHIGVDISRDFCRRQLERIVEALPGRGRIDIGAPTGQRGLCRTCGDRHSYGDETDIAFVRLAHLLHDAGATLALATHDRVLREALLAAFGAIPVEMLLGVRTEDADELHHRGVPVRLYVPFGDGWFRYTMRRIAEAQGA